MDTISHSWMLLDFVDNLNYAIRKYKICNTKIFITFVIQKVEFHQNNKPHNLMIVESNQEIDNKDKEHFKKELTACISSKMTQEGPAYIWFYINSTEPLEIKRQHIDLIKTLS